VLTDPYNYIVVAAPDFMQRKYGFCGARKKRGSCIHRAVQRCSYQYLSIYTGAAVATAAVPIYS
jgi:hypothetical protein